MLKPFKRAVSLSSYLSNGVARDKVFKPAREAIKRLYG